MHPVAIAFLTTCATYLASTLSSSAVFFVHHVPRRFLDGMLGMAAGVMISASYGLLGEASISAERENIPPSVVLSSGLILGALVLWIFDMLFMHFSGDHHDVSAPSSPKTQEQPYEDVREDMKSLRLEEHESSDEQDCEVVSVSVESRKSFDEEERCPPGTPFQKSSDTPQKNSRIDKRVLLLLTAITLHNIPEGLGVGVVMGAAGSNTVSLSSAISIALGIAIHNIPEGMAVVFPLIQCGVSPLKAFLLCQITAIVEPIAGVIGASLVVVFSKVVPFGLTFATGAMIYVVVDELIPLSRESGSRHISTIGTMAGFIGMTVLQSIVGEFFLTEE